MIAEQDVSQPPVGAADVVGRLRAAINDHDLDALVACFAPDYRNETPVHPGRSFTGSEQVRRNWTQILAAVPDLHAEIVRRSDAAGEAWVEWEWSGTRVDHARHLMRGVTLLGVEDDRIAWARFYMEPVVDDGVDIDGAIRGTFAPQGADR